MRWGSGSVQPCVPEAHSLVLVFSSRSRANASVEDATSLAKLRPNIVVFAVKKIDRGSSYCWQLIGLDAASSTQYRLVVTPAAAYDLLGRDVNRNIGSRVENAKKLLQAMIRNVYPAAARKALRASQTLNPKDITVVAHKFGASACLVSALKLGDGAQATLWLEGCVRSVVRACATEPVRRGLPHPLTVASATGTT